MLFDTHLHLIYPDKLGYPWLSEVPALNKPYHYEEYEIIANRLGIDACFHMEVDVREEDIKNETTMLESLSSQPASKIKGIITGENVVGTCTNLSSTLKNNNKENTYEIYSFT